MTSNRNILDMRLYVGQGQGHMVKVHSHMMINVLFSATDAANWLISRSEDGKAT